MPRIRGGIENSRIGAQLPAQVEIFPIEGQQPLGRSPDDKQTIGQQRAGSPLEDMPRVAQMAEIALRRDLVQFPVGGHEDHPVVHRRRTVSETQVGSPQAPAQLPGLDVRPVERGPLLRAEQRISRQSHADRRTGSL